MDIKIDREYREGKNYFEDYAQKQLHKYFTIYPFLESIKVFFRGDKHPTKKVKIHARLKGKDVFVEASGAKHDIALDNASVKFKTQAEKYKTKHYKRA